MVGIGEWESGAVTIVIIIIAAIGIMGREV